jgi:uncharacterized protein YjbI with pentapeptide repeats
MVTKEKLLKTIKEKPDVFSRYTEVFPCKIDLCKANLQGANLSGATLRGANMRDADLRSANLCDANMRGADLYNADLCKADLRNANLRAADLYSANMKDANLMGANLRGANLHNANLSGANMQNANLYGADLRDANMQNAVLTGTVLNPSNPVPDTDLSEYLDIQGVTVNKHGIFVGYRTSKSIYIGTNVYEPGKTYTAPVFSTSTEDECHPGLYLYATLYECKKEHPACSYVKVVVNIRDTMLVDGKIRTKRFRVVKMVE